MLSSLISPPGGQAYRGQVTGFRAAVVSDQGTVITSAFGGGVGCGVEVEGGIGGGRGFSFPSAVFTRISKSFQD